MYTKFQNACNLHYTMKFCFHIIINIFHLKIIRWSLEEICQQYRSEEIAQYSNNTWFNTFTTVVSNMLFVPETTDELSIEVPHEIRLVIFISFFMHKLLF